MFQNNWFGEEQLVDDIDPGKDIFALLFLSFFLINAVVLFCVSEQQQENVSVNTAGKGQGKTIEQSFLAKLKTQNDQLCIVQNNKCYCLPGDLITLIKQAKFESRKDKNGQSIKLLTIKDPGKSISAGALLSVIQILNKANIGVDFHSVETMPERFK